MRKYFSSKAMWLSLFKVLFHDSTKSISRNCWLVDIIPLVDSSYSFLPTLSLLLLRYISTRNKCLVRFFDKKFNISKTGSNSHQFPYDIFFENFSLQILDSSRDCFLKFSKWWYFCTKSDSAKDKFRIVIAKIKATKKKEQQLSDMYFSTHNN